MRSLMLGLAMALVAGASAHSAPGDSQADWLKKPKAEDVLAVWPTQAWKHGVGGVARVTCTVTVQGALRDCVVASEAPAGAGFGAAAIALTPQFLLKPKVVGGQAVEDTVTIPVKFPTPNIKTGTIIPGDTTRDVMSTRIIFGVVWQQAPAVADVVAAYPAKARDQKITGRATLNCAFKADGRLTGCSTLTEDPVGLGFGRAARTLASLFKGPTVDGQGQPLKGAHVHLQMTFPADALGNGSLAIGKPQWAGLPTPADFRQAFPEAASKAGILRARVVLNCAIGAGGALTTCQTQSEDPPGYGFGRGAAALSDKFKVTVWTAEGLPTVGGTVRVPIRYDLPPATAPAKP